LKKENARLLQMLHRQKDKFEQHVAPEQSHDNRKRNRSPPAYSEPLFRARRQW
jgi:hypothetical protein